MNRQKISPRDWEMLSAYLDGELTERQRQDLEARLTQEASLQAALDELRDTRTALRSLPPLRAPRNFTLSAEMAGARSMASLYPRLRLASALAGVLFAVLLVGDLMGLSGLATLERVPSVALVSQMETTGEPEGLLVEAESAEPMVAVPMAGEAAEAPEPVATEAAPRKAVPEASPVAVSIEEEQADEALVETFPTPAPTATISRTSQPRLPTATLSTDAAATLAKASAISLLRLLEGVLALIALGTGVTARLLRDR
jgi:anti-sigma factor RsiW